MKNTLHPPENNFWNRPLAELLDENGSRVDQGLPSVIAQERLLEIGPNIATSTVRISLWRQFLMRFRNPLILLLLLAAGLSAATGDVASFLFITAILALSVTMDFVQEVRAEKTVDALRRSVALTTLVVRDGEQIELPVSELVPGDIVLMSPGKLVPADGRILDAKDLFVNQSLLTGESFPIEKYCRELTTPTGSINDAVNAAFMGSSVISGSGRMLVVNSGKQTQLGRLSSTLAQRHPTTSFERGVERFGLLLLRLAMVMVLFVLLVNVGFHRPMLESFLFALALAVGLAPELLPMIVTITLARGARQMAAAEVIVKHLPAMHNLGAMDVLCTDKTGTLTEARISLVKTLDVHEEESARVFLLAYLNSVFESGVKASLDQAILDHGSPDISAWQKLDEIPFDFERRRISVLVHSNSKRLLIVKGAPEDIIKLSTHYEDEQGILQPFDDAQCERSLTAFNRLGEQGYRALAVAFREVDTMQTTATITDESQLTFAGFAVFFDPPKADAAETLQVLKRDGIQVKVISGDNERVTQHVCEMLGFDTGEILTGETLAGLSDEALLMRVEQAHVFCRVTPQQKSRIISMLQKRGHTVGFLGDGINDAAALHVADVGISVESATDVAKEAADIILLKPTLSAIHAGVIEGRRAVVNTEKYILMGSSSSFGNIFSMAGATLILPFLPMLPIQVLLNNLLYDISQTAVPLDRVDAERLANPVHWDIGRVKRFMWILGPASSVFDFLTFYALLHLFTANEAMFHTGWFVESLVTQTLIIFSIRTCKPLFKSRPHPILCAAALGIAAVALILPLTMMGRWMGLVPMPGVFYAFLLGALLAYFGLIEAIKYGFRRVL